MNKIHKCIYTERETERNREKQRERERERGRDRERIRVSWTEFVKGTLKIPS